jgi:hypothetical protein
MNVYFCDVCGVRVTDVDLHAGHGMRRRNDVICAACIDLGHGKEWVEAHAQRKAPAMAGAVAGGANGHDAGPSSRPVEIARDRLRTLDEDEPASPVKPVQLPVPASAAPVPEFDDTAQVPVVSQELASTAAGFAALTPPKVEKSATDEDDIEELPPPKLDDSGPSPKLDDSGSSPKLDDSADHHVVAASSPFDAGVKIEDRADDLDEDEDGDAQKSETAVSEKSIDESDRPESKKSPSTRKATSSSRVSKAGKSSRAKRGPKKNSQQQFMLMSIAGMALIILIGSIVIVSSKGGTHTDGGKIPVNYTTALKESASRCHQAQTAAAGTHDEAKLNAARSAYMDLRSAMDAYTRVAHEKGMNDDQIGDAMSGYKVNDIISVDRLIRDELVQLKH